LENHRHALKTGIGQQIYFLKLQQMPDARVAGTGISIQMKVKNQEIKGLSFPNSLFKKQVIRRINRLATDFKFDLMKSQELIDKLSKVLLRIHFYCHQNSYKVYLFGKNLY
jgi:hypothetical protein